MTAPGSTQLSRSKLLIILALCAGLNACGQIGPLYLPETAPPAGATDSEASKNTSETTLDGSTPSAQERDPKDKPNGL